MGDKGAKEPNPNRESQQEYFGIRAGEPPSGAAKGGLIRGDLLGEFAKLPAVQAFLEPGVPEVERRASHDLEVLEAHVAKVRGVACMPHSGNGLGYQADCPRCQNVTWLAEGRLPSPAPTFSESWASYRAALYAIHGTLGTAHSLLHNECMRTPCGSDAWETLLAFSKKVNAISEALAKEIERVPAAGEVK